MKICFVSETIDPMNGSGRFAYSMITSLQKDFGIDATVLTCRGEILTIPGAKDILFSRGYFSCLILNPLIIAWHARKSDLLHAFDGWPCMVMSFLASRLIRKPYTDSLYGTYAVGPLLDWRLRGLMRASYAHASLNAAISTVTATRIREADSTAKIDVVLQGIFHKAYLAPRPRILPEGTSYILSVATMKRRKGYHVSIPAFAKILQKYPDLKYVIVAKRDEQSQYYQKIKALIEKHQCASSLIWKEDLVEEELISLYQYASVFFVPSISLEEKGYFEGFGSVYLEAQACGTPVVTSRGGGQEEAIIDGETGILVEEGNIDHAADAVLRLLNDVELHKRFSISARAFAKRMDWSEVLKFYMERFRGLISKRS